MKLRLCVFIALLAELVFPAVNNFDPEEYRETELYCVHLKKPLELDGFLREDLYRTAPCSVFIQVDPDNGKPASEKTEVWIGYDDEALYVGAHLWDSNPDSIVARKVRRDASFNSDEFQVAIDAYHDRRSGFFFTVNPAGSISDGSIANDSWFDNTWDGIWYVKTRIDSSGWIVEMKIPYSQLRFNRQESGVYTWGIGLGRIIQRRNEHSLNFYLPRGESGAVSHFPVLQGLKGISPPQRIEGIPYITGAYGNIPSEKDNPFYRGKSKYSNLGIDLKLGIGSNITVDATINPDFGQVEVDPSVINLSAYETYYEEKRPFFIEGANIFSFGRGGPTNRWGFNFSEPSFFYSRRIGRAPQGEVDSDGWVEIPSATTILGAAKISGKLKGDWAIGGLTALTSQEFARIDEDSVRRREKVEPLTSYNILRTLKEFNDGKQGIGFITTYVHRFFRDFSITKGFLSKDEDDLALEGLLTSNAKTFGMDGWTFLNKDKDWVLSGWLGFSEVDGTKEKILDLQQSSGHYFQRPDQEHVSVDSNLTSLSGYAGRFILNKETGHLIFNTALGFISPGFESNDLGINFRTDRINKHVVIGYKWYDPGKIFRYSQINLAYTSNHNFNGIKNNEMVFLFGFAQFLNYWSINGFSGWGPRTLDDSKTRGGPMVISPRGFFANAEIESDDRKDVVFGAGVNGGKSEKGSRSIGYSTFIEFKISNAFDLSFEPEFDTDRDIAQYVTSVDDPSAENFYGKRYIFAQIDQKTFSMDIRLNWSLTPTLSLQTFIQPFIAVGDYSKYKEFRRPESYQFFIYGEEGSITETEDGYILDPTGGDDDDAFQIDRPDFNYKAIVGNMVLRWEFFPGSNLYLVWTRNGSKYVDDGKFRFSRDFRKLIKASTDDVLAIKLSYWIG